MNQATLPLRDIGFNLSKLEFRDAVVRRYFLPVTEIPKLCVCGSGFTCGHAMVNKKRGFVSLKLNVLRDITYEMIDQVSREFEHEPVLFPLSGGQLH